jgi:hypothetical protein
MTGLCSRINFLAAAVRAAHSNLFTKALLSLGAILLAVVPINRPVMAQSGHEFAFCSGYFALCAASTCKPTGRRIKVNVTGGGTAYFPEADCTCPIFSGQGVTDLAGGNMHGSCTPPVAPDGSVGIWSYYAAHSHIAQEITGWVAAGPKALAPPMICSKSLKLGNTLANCFAFACDSQSYINGVPVATCHCPIGESLDGTAVPPRTAFFTQAGQDDQAYCAKHPVSGPISTPLP